MMILNENSNDGCSKQCTIEIGYVCIGEPSNCTPLCGKERFDPTECTGASYFKVDLSGNKVDPPVETTLNGFVVIRLTDQGKLLYNVLLSKENNLSIAIERSGIELMRFDGTSGQTRSLTQAELVLLKSGELDIVVKTDAYPDGEVFGTISNSESRSS
ncbi:CHRD domain-containing protein [Patescibacteria group bacterium]|nr:CHRD domain-containing protein [Patescibacteria group bacterium]